MGEKRAYKARKSGGGRKKLKPEYDAGKNLKEQMDAAVALYNSEVSLQAIGEELGLNPIKVRKLLITAGVYESEVAEKVQDTFEEYRETQDYITSMLHVRKRNRQKYSEACRPILGKHTDGWAGRIIDLLAVFALLAGTATTFSVATPLMATIISELFHVAVSRTVINIIILLITCAVYIYSLLYGFKGISKLANICIYMFFGLIAFVLLFGGETRYIIETGFSSLGRMIQNFVDLSTFTDPLRTSNFPQNWTIYYWAYWMVWCVAAPFFIGSISRGRTVRQTILGGYVFGVGSTLTSFIVLGNYSMGMQVTGKADFIAQYLESGDLYGMIVSIIKTMPGAPVIMVVVLLTMIAFYATSFDSIALTASCYSYHTLEDGEQPNKGIQLMWCILLILLPIALLFAESSMNNLQSVSIVAAFPIGAVIVMIAVSFMKDAKKYMESLEDKE
ncbi:BCCT family transporter [Faecalibacterium sp. 9]|uniref:BCCT family transporter n=1 Tax=Faecalibacterium sp. 9 TaxID=3402018 RepID=UPI003AAAC034